VQRISTHEPVTQLQHVPIIECGEQLVNYLELSGRLKVGAGRWVYRRENLLRKSVAEMLARAAEALPPSYTLAVVEGWRPPHIQRRMYLAAWKRWKERHPEWSELALRRVVNRFTAPPHRKVPPPHTTGGAVDVWLGDETGRTLDHLSPYEVGSARAYPSNARGLGAEALLHRRILSKAMADAGITNYPSEYWHWSYGDQGWAYRGSHPNAIYGPITPPGYVPPVEEDVDEPLLWVD
jgi:D-alanyl-D-alanine dipeptidase